MDKALKLILILGLATVPAPGQFLRQLLQPQPVSGSGSWSAIQGTSREAAFSGGHCTLTPGSGGFGSNVTSGDLLVVGDIDSSANTATLSVSDSLGSTFHQAWLGNSASSPVVGGYTIEGWSTTLTSSGSDTITFTTSTSGTTQCVAAEFHWSLGGISATPFDQAGVIGQFTSTPSVTTAGNLAANGELVIGWFGNSAASGYAGAGTGFTLIAGDTGGFMEYEFLASGSGSGATQTATAATTSGGTSANAVGTFEHP